MDRGTRKELDLFRDTEHAAVEAPAVYLQMWWCCGVVGVDWVGWCEIPAGRRRNRAAELSARSEHRSCQSSPAFTRLDAVHNYPASLNAMQLELISRRSHHLFMQAAMTVDCRSAANTALAG